MRTVRLLIGFDGTRYEGWQSQRKDRTIQEIFEKILLRLFKERTDLVSSSRTDSGVHALGLVAHFKTASRLSDRKIKDALNFYLPRDILVRAAKTVDNRFHARFSAKSKLYRYDIWRSATRPLREGPYALWHPGPLDLPLMRKASRHLLGTHDFSAFQDGGDQGRGAVRTIRSIRIAAKGPLVRIEVKGNGFLRHMVRIIVGTLIEVGRRKLPPEALPGIIASKKRPSAGPTAKSHGLTLVKVQY
ncbi:MAG TPA: tRNA pseudouridine(38-40) synthase TruA [Candidatus Eisenbacteria bacterium]|nr:tRNA pseudouridine(38-40) synthase TruA [Candidatus Eisenbacteria bacterium]